MKIPITSLDDWIKPGRQDADSLMAMKIGAKVSRHLRGQGPIVQSAVLADLLAMFLAGIQGEDKEHARNEFMEMVIALTWQLVPVNEARLLDATFGRKADQ